MGWQVVYVPFLFAGNSIINQQGVFVYSSTPTLGDLIASIASQAGVDQFNNKVQAGITSYVTIAGTTYAIGLNSLSGTGLPGLSMGDINFPPTAVAGFFGEASGAVGTPQAFAAITSGQATAADVATFISVLSQVQAGNTGGLIVLQAGLTQLDSNGNLVNLFAAPDGDLHFIDGGGGASGDGREYATVGRFLYTTVDYTINTFNGTQMAQLTQNLSVGASTPRPYYVRGKIRFLSGSGTTQPINVKFVGTAAVSGMFIETNMYLEAAGTTSNYGFISAMNAGPAVQIGNVANATIVTFEWEGIMIVSTSGTFIPNPYIITAGDEPFTAQAGRCWSAVSPIDLSGN